MNKISIILLVLVILLGIGLAAALIYYNSMVYELKDENNEQKSRLENLGAQILENEDEIEDLTTQTQDVEKQVEERAEYLTKYSEYTDETIGISFFYPKSWGEIVVREEPMGEPGQTGTAAHALALKIENENIFPYIFLNAIAAKGPDRGGYWGDEALNISGDDWVNNLCSEKENCAVFTNQNGITIAKLTEPSVALNEVTTATATAQYYLYNPNNIFHGIILSTAALENTMTETINIAEGLEEIANTLKFL